jgi:hypothetical protein
MSTRRSFQIHAVCLLVLQNDIHAPTSIFLGRSLEWLRGLYYFAHHNGLCTLSKKFLNNGALCRVMKQADAELAALDSKKKAGANVSPQKVAELKAVHQKVSAQLQELRALAAKEGVDTSAPQGGSNVAEAHEELKLETPIKAEVQTQRY